MNTRDTKNCNKYALGIGILVVSAASFAKGDTTSPSADTKTSIFVDTSALATPNAQEFVMDVPSAFHSTRYQRGQIGPWTYVLYPDGSAKIMSGQGQLKTIAALDCMAGQSCNVSNHGQSNTTIPVEAGLQPTLPSETDLASVTTYLARWILAGTAPDPIIQPPSKIDVIPDPKPDPIPAAEDTLILAIAEAPVRQEASEPNQQTILAAAESTTAPQPTSPTSVPAEPPVATPTPRPENLVEAPVAAFVESRPVGVQNITATRAATSPATEIADQTAQTPIAETPQEDKKAKRPKFNCSISMTGSLAHFNGGVGKPRASLGCGAQLTKRLSLRTTIFGYGNPDLQEDWDPDYNYAFTYRVNDRITLTYSHYLARYSPHIIPLADLFDGNFRASYKLPALTFPNEKSMSCSAGIGLPNPTEESVTLFCGYSVTDKLRIGGTLYFYFPGAQETYDFDYSYIASYKITDNWVLAYNNYSNNRWGWNKGDDPGPGFKGGSMSLSYRFSF